MSKIVAFFVALVALVAGIVLVVMSAAGGTHTTTSLGGHLSTPGNMPLFIIGLLLMILSVLGAVALIVAVLVSTRTRS